MKSAFDISKVFLSDEGYVYPEWISENYIIDSCVQAGVICWRLFRVYKISEEMLENWNWKFVEEHFGCGKDEFDYKEYQWYEADLVQIFDDEPEYLKKRSDRKENSYE